MPLRKEMSRFHFTMHALCAEAKFTNYSWKIIHHGGSLLDVMYSLVNKGVLAFSSWAIAHACLLLANATEEDHWIPKPNDEFYVLR